MPVVQPVSDPLAQNPPAARVDGRCPVCGYGLRGLPEAGKCPECGRPYDQESARYLRPWPRALAGQVWRCWPLGGVALGVAYIFCDGDSGPPILPGWIPALIVLGGFLSALKFVVNCQAMIRSTLEQSLPCRTRAEGGVSVLLWIGKIVGLFAAVLFILAYALLAWAYGLTKTGMSV